MRCGKHLSSKSSCSLTPICTGLSRWTPVFLGTAARSLAGWSSQLGFDRLLPKCRERFDRSGQPRGLHLFQVVAVGNGKGRGLSVLAAEGLVTRYTYRCSFTVDAELFGKDLGSSVLACPARYALVHGNEPAWR